MIYAKNINIKISSPQPALLAELLQQAPAASVRISNSPLPGSEWAEQGGIYAGIMRGDDGTLYHLIVSPKDAGDFDSVKFGPTGTDIEGAGSAWDGLSNTIALVRHEKEHPAAATAAGLSINGFKDWYLPAQAELSLCRATIRDQFDAKAYWSSTQYSGNDAWCQSFNDGYQYIFFKLSQCRVRAVRRLIIQ